MKDTVIYVERTKLPDEREIIAVKKENGDFLCLVQPNGIYLNGDISREEYDNALRAVEAAENVSPQSKSLALYAVILNLYEKMEKKYCQ